MNFVKEGRNFSRDLHMGKNISFDFFEHLKVSKYFCFTLNILFQKYVGHRNIFKATKELLLVLKRCIIYVNMFQDISNRQKYPPFHEKSEESMQTCHMMFQTDKSTLPVLK